MQLHDVGTPALLVDLDAFEGNLDRMATDSARTSVKVRPHAKAHKCPQIALRQISGGATGICCQTIGEAEVMVRFGVRDVLVTNEVVDERKLRRLASLAKHATMGVCVDHPAGVKALNNAAEAYHVQVDVLIEVNVGGDRCGVDVGESLLSVANEVAVSRNLRFRGLQAYQGRAQHIRQSRDRHEAIVQSTRVARCAVELLAQQGLVCEVISGGGTGTFPFEMGSGLYNEVQPGSYVFMDADYHLNCHEPVIAGGRFRQSLFVYTQVISVPRSGTAIVDAGLKAIAFDSGMPTVTDLPGVVYGRPSDEHGVLDLRDFPGGLDLGSKLKLIPGHCDPTVNLYDRYVAIRGDTVEAIWPIAARGAFP
jgi:3-hydroxy-D-aspartate aldolase